MPKKKPASAPKKASKAAKAKKAPAAQPLSATRSRAEIEAEIRSVAPTCRGPRNQDPGPALDRLTKQRGLSDGAALALSEAAEAGHETTDAAITALLDPSLDDGHREAARLLDAATRAGCGYAVAELYLSEPLDGQEHEKPCPQCGQTIRWTAAKAA